MSDSLAIAATPGATVRATQEQATELAASDVFLQCTINLFMGDQGMLCEVIYADGAPKAVAGWGRRPLSDEPGEILPLAFVPGPECPADDNLGPWSPMAELPSSALFDEKNIAHVVALFIGNNLDAVIPTACAQYMQMRQKVVAGLKDSRIITNG